MGCDAKRTSADQRRKCSDRNIGKSRIDGRKLIVTAERFEHHRTGVGVRGLSDEAMAEVEAKFGLGTPRAIDEGVDVRADAKCICDVHWKIKRRTRQQSCIYKFELIVIAIVE